MSSKGNGGCEIMTEPELLEIGWPEVESWLRTISVEATFDTIVGITRCGLPIAVALSFLAPHAMLAVMARTKARGPKPASYNFGVHRESRVATLHGSFELTPWAGKPRNVLIVDDVATFGDTFLVAREKVLDKAPDAQVKFACYAADDVRLGSANPDILNNLICEKFIDNATTWVTFPWNLVPNAEVASKTMREG